MQNDCQRRKIKVRKFLFNILWRFEVVEKNPKGGGGGGFCQTSMVQNQGENSFHRTLSDPNLTMTSQFPQKSQHRFFPDSRLQNKVEGKKKVNLCFSES